MAERDEKKIKMAVIAGASEALNYQMKNPRATESEILQHVSKRIRELVRNIEIE